MDLADGGSVVPRDGSVLALAVLSEGGCQYVLDVALLGDPVSSLCPPSSGVAFHVCYVCGSLLAHLGICCGVPMRFAGWPGRVILVGLADVANVCVNCVCGV